MHQRIPSISPDMNSGKGSGLDGSAGEYLEVEPPDGGRGPAMPHAEDHGKA